MKWGLLVCAHGSRNRAWNERVAEVAASLRPHPAVRERFDDRIAIGFLEQASPGISESTRALFRMGSERIVVIPLFLSRSSHLEVDLPAALAGAGEEPVVIPPLHASALDIGRIVLGPPLATSTALAVNVARRALRHTSHPHSTGVVVAYYGSPRRQDAWHEVVARVGKHLVEVEGFAGFGEAPVGHWVLEGPLAVTRALEQGLATWERAVVVPLLISVGDYQTAHIPAGITALGAAQRERVRHSADAILPCPTIHQWVIDEALHGSSPH